MLYLGRILHDITAAPSLFHTPARQNVTTLELLISKPFICGDEQRHGERKKEALAAATVAAAGYVTTRSIRARRINALLRGRL